jgi:hypothetical protein
LVTAVAPVSIESGRQTLNPRKEPTAVIQSHAALYAFNASTLARLYESDASTNARDDFGEHITFSTPTISDRLVYAANRNVFG